MCTILPFVCLGEKTKSCQCGLLLLKCFDTIETVFLMKENFLYNFLIQYIFHFLQVSFLPAMSLSHSQLPLQPVIVHYITAFNENYLLLTHLSELANVSRHIPPILASPPAQPNHPLPTNLSPHSSLPPFQA